MNPRMGKCFKRELVGEIAGLVRRARNLLELEEVHVWHYTHHKTHFIVTSPIIFTRFTYTFFFSWFLLGLLLRPCRLVWVLSSHPNSVRAISTGQPTILEFIYLHNIYAKWKGSQIKWFFGGHTRERHFGLSLLPYYYYKLQYIVCFGCDEPSSHSRARCLPTFFYSVWNLCVFALLPVFQNQIYVVGRDDDVHRRLIKESIILTLISPKRKSLSERALMTLRQLPAPSDEV